jgi:Ser/Thr protein kinase RdoA (MazF antagonist)
VGTDDLDSAAVPSGALAAEVAEVFGLTGRIDWRDLGGSSTANLLITGDGSPVVARVHQGGKSSGRLLAEQAARNALADAGIPAVRPLAGPSGQTVARLPGGRLAELEAFVTWDTRMNSEPLVRRGFGVLARVHDVLRTVELPAAARTVRRANHILAADAAAATRRGAERMRSWGEPGLSRFADDVVAHIDGVWAREEPLAAGQVTQIVHGDFWDNNVLFRGDDLAAVIDFDFMAERPRIDDLALTAYFWFLQPGKGVPGLTEARELRRFVDAYDAAAALPLSPEERMALPLAIARQPAWSVGRWIVDLEHGHAVRHAWEAAAEQPVARAILTDLAGWQDALTGRDGRGRLDGEDGPAAGAR